MHLPASYVTGITCIAHHIITYIQYKTSIHANSVHFFTMYVKMFNKLFSENVVGILIIFFISVCSLGTQRYFISISIICISDRITSAAVTYWHYTVSAKYSRGVTLDSRHRFNMC